MTVPPPPASTPDSPGASIASGVAFTATPRILPDLMERAAARWPDRVAVDFLGRTWRYGEISRMVERAARGLHRLGLRKGDRFALCLPNTPYFVVMYFAALRLGAVVVNLNPLYTPRELEHLLRDSGARMIALPDIATIHAKVEPVARAVGVEKLVMCPFDRILPRLKAWGWRLFKRREHVRFTEDGFHVSFCAMVMSAPPLPADRPPVLPEDLAVLQYTGGTTGVPKGAMLSHANLAANAEQMVVHVGHDLERQERVLGVLPLFHVFALTTVLDFSVEIGAEMVLLPRFEMDQYLATVRRTLPTIMFGVPTIWVALNHLSAEDAAPLSCFETCISGGAPLPLDVRASFEARTGAVVTEGYGLSEASPIITCNPVGGPIRDNSCGHPFPGTIVEIRDPETGAILPPGARGEVCARGPQVMMGYWNRPEDTAKVFVDGALRTGDIGVLDADGYLTLVDRIKDVILCGGYNVYPRMIEDAAYQHPAVEEAIAIGIPDAYRGQSPKLFVKLHDGAHVSAEELTAFLSGLLSRIEVPREIEFRDALPKTLVGKLSKKELVEEERLKAEAATDEARKHPA